MTTTPLFLVTGATGNTGSGLVPALLAAGARVRALVHTPAKAEALRTLGAEPVIADLGQPDDGLDELDAIGSQDSDMVTELQPERAQCQRVQLRHPLTELRIGARALVLDQRHLVGGAPCRSAHTRRDGERLVRRRYLHAFPGDVGHEWRNPRNDLW